MRNSSYTCSFFALRQSRMIWVLLIIFSGSLLPSVSIAQTPTATIANVTGTVLVNGQMQGQGTVLGTGDVLETQAGALVVLQLSDGSLIEIREQSKVDLTVLAQTAAGARTSRLKLLWGRIRASLSAGHQKEGSTFDIETPNALIGVKFSQPDVEVSYDPANTETRALALTVALSARNFVTDEEKIVPVGALVILSALGTRVIAGGAATGTISSESIGQGGAETLEPSATESTTPEAGEAQAESSGSAESGTSEAETSQTQPSESTGTDPTRTELAEQAGTGLSGTETSETEESEAAEEDAGKAKRRRMMLIGAGAALAAGGVAVLASGGGDDGGSSESSSETFLFTGTFIRVDTFTQPAGVTTIEETWQLTENADSISGIYSLVFSLVVCNYNYAQNVTGTVTGNNTAVLNRPAVSYDECGTPETASASTATCTLQNSGNTLSCNTGTTTQEYQRQ